MLASFAHAFVDVREIAPAERHQHIFSVFSRLAKGQYMEFVNDHDPLPLFQSFQARLPGQFNWGYVEKGPARWRVAISRLAAASDTSPCCGASGGH